MRWWKSIWVRALAVVLFFACALPARGETILRLEPTPKKAAAKKKQSFSVRGISRKDDAELERYSAFLLGGKKEQPEVRVASKKKAPLPPVQWDQKHAKKVELKGVKVKHKPVKSAPVTPVQWSLAPTPMAASAVELPAASVPTPKALWAGLAMVACLAGWRWLAVRRAA